MTMVESEFHLLQVQEEPRTADAVVAPELGLGVSPEVLDAVDVLPFPLGESAIVPDAVVPVAIGDEAIVGAPAVRVDGAAGGNLLADDGPERGLRHVGDRRRVHPAVPLQNAEDNDLSGSAPSAHPLAAAAEVRLVHLVLPGTERRLGLAGTGDRAADYGVEAVGAVAVDPRLARRAGRRHLQGEVSNELSDLSIRELAPLDRFPSHEPSLGDRIS